MESTCSMKNQHLLPCSGLVFRTTQIVHNLIQVCYFYSVVSTLTFLTVKNFKVKSILDECTHNPLVARCYIHPRSVVQ